MKMNRLTMACPAQTLDQKFAIMLQAGFPNRRKQPLFEKSGAKTSFMLGHGRLRRQRPWPKLAKFFCYFLFTKSSLLLRLALAGSIRPGNRSCKQR
jgi:hypothetical protein